MHGPELYLTAFAAALGDLNRGQPSRRIGGSTPPTVSGVSVGHTQPPSNPDEPALQRDRHPGCALPLLATAPNRRRSHRLAPGRHRTRNRRRVSSPSRTPARATSLRDRHRGRAHPPWFLAGRERTSRQRDTLARPDHLPDNCPSRLVGTVGGIYGIGGGSILAPILIGAGTRPAKWLRPPWPRRLSPPSSV